MLPFDASMNEPDSSSLCDFVTDCHLPETIQVVEGYESLESEELSWCKDEIINLHTLKEISWVVAQDVHGHFFSIPLTYHGKIFESIPTGCADRYETVEELILAPVPFPKYVRSLRDIPQSGVTVGDILLLLEAPNSRGRKEFKCRVVGKPRTISLSGKQVGPFETLKDATPISIQEVINGNGLPTRVRVLAGKTQAFDGANTIPPVKFEGSFILEEAVQQKVFIVSTFVERQLRVLKLPIDLEITVRRKKSKIHPNVFSYICHLIETEVNFDSTITCGRAGEASWFFFNIDDNMYEPPIINDDIYEEIPPLVPPRTLPPNDPKPKPDGSHLKQNITNNKSIDTRYAPSPNCKPKPLKKPSVAKKPNKLPPYSECFSPERNNSAQFTSQNKESHIEPRRPEADHRDSCRTAKTFKDEQTVQIDEKVSFPTQKKVVRLPKTNQEKDDEDDTYATIVDEEAFNQLHIAMPEHPNSNAHSDDTIRGQNPQHRDTFNQGPQQMASDRKEDPSVEAFRKRLQDNSVSEVSEWLRQLGLSQYVDLFAEESVDGAMLLELDDEMMKCVGIENSLHRKKLLMFIQRGWTPKL